MARHYISQDNHRHRSVSHSTREPSHSSSAFSPSAQPDEDWTKITDLAERRRIQNRIAQRNYRRKLKQRMEDTDKPESASSSPEPTPTRQVAASKSKRHSDTARSPSSDTHSSQQSQVHDDALGHEEHTDNFTTTPTFSFSLSDQYFTSSTYPNQQTTPFLCSLESTDIFHDPHDSLYTFEHYSPHDRKSYFQPSTDTMYDYSHAQGLDYAPSSGSYMSSYASTSSTSGLDFLETPGFGEGREHSICGSPGDLTAYPVTPTVFPPSPHFVVFEL